MAARQRQGGQPAPDHQGADQISQGGSQIHHLEAVADGEREGGRRPYHPGQGELGPQHRAEHVRPLVTAVGVFARQGKQLGAGGGGQARQHHPQAHQQPVLPVPGKQQGEHYAGDTAAQDQLLAIPPVVGAMAEPLADEDADHRVDGIEEPHQEGAHLHLFGQKQAQGGHLECHRHPGHEGHGEERERDGIRPLAGSTQQTHRDTIDMEEKKGARSRRMYSMTAIILCDYQQPPQGLRGHVQVRTLVNPLASTRISHV